jgi:hypothetical protein
MDLKMDGATIPLKNTIDPSKIEANRVVRLSIILTFV